MAFAPIYMKDALCEIAETDFTKELSSVRLRPSSSTATWKGLTPDSVHQAPSTTTWVAEISYAQDWDESTSFARYLFEHEGETKTMTFRPRSGGAGFEVEVVIQPGEIGGNVDAFAEASISLPINGKPAPVEPETPPETPPA